MTVTATIADRELQRLHRRACTDFAARLRLPAWEHLPMALAPPMEDLTVGDLLCRVADGNLAAAAELSGQARPDCVELGMEPTEVVVESIRTVLTVVSALDAATGLSPARRQLLWERVVELTVLGYDLQQAIRAGAGLDDLLVDRILTAAPEVSIWPQRPALATEPTSPPLVRFLASHGRSAGLWVDPTDPTCGTGQC